MTFNFYPLRVVNSWVSFRVEPSVRVQEYRKAIFVLLLFLRNLTFVTLFYILVDCNQTKYNMKSKWYQRHMSPVEPKRIEYWNFSFVVASFSCDGRHITMSRTRRSAWQYFYILHSKWLILHTGQTWEFKLKLFIIRFSDKSLPNAGV